MSRDARPPTSGPRMHRKASTASTMDDARALAEAGAEHGTAVIADEQTAGRGRESRAWISPRGGLYMSIVLRPALPVPRWTLIPIAAGVALHDVLIRRVASARLKWPNDVTATWWEERRKLAGVLVDARPPEFAVVGVGVNILRTGLPEVAISMEALGADLPQGELATKVLDAVLLRVQDLEAGNDAEVRAAWEAACGMLGERVQAEGVEGVAVGLAEDGGLVVVRDGGVREVVRVGDVTSR